MSATRDTAAPVQSQIALARRLLANGYRTVPILRHDAPAFFERDGRQEPNHPGKRPHGGLWHDKERAVYAQTADSIGAWARIRGIEDCPGLGIACGEAIGLDLDILERRLCRELRRVAFARLGRTPLRRTGQAPKLLLVYRAADGPLHKVATPELWKGGVKAQIEILGRGQQFVAFGVHPATRESYAWAGPTPEKTPLSALPAVTQEQVAAFVAEAGRVLRAAGYQTKAEAGAPGAAPLAGGPRANGHARDDADDPFRTVNDVALADLGAWVPELFPSARFQPATGAWRVSSRDLGRDFEEDLSLSPKGIKDWGLHDQGDPREGRRTPLDVVMQRLGLDLKAAAAWLAERTGTLSSLKSLTSQIGPKSGKASNGAASATLPSPNSLSSPLLYEEFAWPRPLGEAAYHGVAGRIVRALAPQTEADPVAILVDLLAGFGNQLGTKPFFMVNKTRHRPGLFVLTVGATAKGRKGTAGDLAMDVLRQVDPEWARERVLRGDLSTGEGLIHQVRDPVERLVGHGKDRHVEVVDEGVEDKRLLVESAEFAATLRMMRRDGNTLSAVVRQAWDRGDLRATSKTNPSVATGAAVAVSGHITVAELRRELCETDAASGFANRFLLTCVKRSKVLPDGGEPVDTAALAAEAGRRLAEAREVDRMRRDAAASALWHRVYPALSAERPGLLGAVTGRAEAQVLRLSMIYALLDGTGTVGEAHLRAALELWRYCRESVSHIFGAALGDHVADTILAALRANPEGLGREAIHGLFSRHETAARIKVAVAELVRSGHAALREVPTGGRPREVLVPLDPRTPGCEESEFGEERSEKAGNGAASVSKEPVCEESEISEERVAGEGGERPRATPPAPASPGPPPTFTPTADWQDLPEDAVLPPGCQTEVDLATGRRRARLHPEGVSSWEAEI